MSILCFLEASGDALAMASYQSVESAAGPERADTP
jgi:hypothetical protein